MTVSANKTWFAALGSALVIGIVYSALMLASKPAYAAECTPEFCQALLGNAEGYCFSRGGLVDFYCDASEWYFTCAVSPIPAVSGTC